MYYKEKEGVVLAFYHNLSPFRNITHFVSTRIGGKSISPFDSLNIGFGTDDNFETVLQNRKILAYTANLDIEQFVFANQVHSCNIAIVDKNDKGSGAKDKISAITKTDALITNSVAVCINVMGADCVPILLYEPEKKVIAAIHAGWRGTALQIASKTIDKMVQYFQVDPSKIVAGIGPSIGQCCYEVSSDVYSEFTKNNSFADNFFILKENGKYMLDLWQANVLQLTDSNVKLQNIEVSRICTHCNNINFFSSRFHNGNTGRFTSAICLV